MRVKDKGDIDGVDVVVDAVNIGIVCFMLCKIFVFVMMYGVLNLILFFLMSNLDFIEFWVYMVFILIVVLDLFDI